MLLRLALAEAALKAPEADKHREMLKARFEASHERGDVVHRREEARYELGLEHDADKALELAKANFGVQKEPWDVRIYLESAKAAKKPAAAKEVIDFVRTNHLEDPRDRRAGAGAFAVSRARFAAFFVALATLLLFARPRVGRTSRATRTSRSRSKVRM